MTKKTKSKTYAIAQDHVVHKKIGVRMAHHHHSGKHLPLRYTSYAALFFIIAIATLAILFAGHAVNAYDQIKNGSISLSGFSKGPPPKYAAVITYPLVENVFDVNHTIVEGTCEAGKFLELYRSSVLAGGAICSDKGTFRFNLTLVPGKNVLLVRIHDALWQYGPDSKPVVVWYNVPVLPTPVLLVYTKPIQNGILLGNELLLDYTVSGGKPPYAVSINWGDNSAADVHVHKQSGTLRVKHKYEQHGQYVIIISAVDETGKTALIQSVVVVHSTNEDIPGTAYTCDGPTCKPPGGVLQVIDYIWPAIIIAALMTLSFWYGEKIVYSHKPFKPRHA